MEEWGIPVSGFTLFVVYRVGVGLQTWYRDWQRNKAAAVEQQRWEAMKGA